MKYNLIQIENYKGKTKEMLNLWVSFVTIVGHEFNLLFACSESWKSNYINFNRRFFIKPIYYIDR